MPAALLRRRAGAVGLAAGALLATTGVLAPEIDDGSIAYLLAKPVSRHTIVRSKLTVAAGCVLAFAVLPVLVAGLVLRTSDPRFALGFALGALAGGLLVAGLAGAAGRQALVRRRETGGA